MTVLVGIKRRWERTRSIHRRYNVFYEILGVLFVLLVIIKIGEHIIFATEDSYHINLFTEGVALAATVFLVDRFYRYRDKSSLQKRLVGEARSRSHDIAISAVEWMDREGWLTGDDGLLKGANLREARLWDARMDGSNLQGTILELAVLCKATLKEANLRDAKLMFAKLHNAKLNEAEMQNAKCHGAEMPNANLSGACLEDADLSYACLEGASLQRTCFNGADLHEAKLKGAFLWDADFCNANLMFSELREAEHHNKANWEGAKLFKPDLKSVDFSETNMKDAVLEYADLRRANLEGTNLEGANLYGALLGGIQFNRIDMPVQVFAGEPPVPEGVGTTYPNPKTNWLGARLPDGGVFLPDMDYRSIERFVDREHEDFPATLERVRLIRKHVGLIEDDSDKPE